MSMMNSSYEEELDKHGPSSLHLVDPPPTRTPTPTGPNPGIDKGLCLLFLNGLITLCWGITLIVLQTGFVPISWNLSQYGQRHRGITNVFITGVATVSTSHLRFTVQNTVHEYSALLVHKGLTLRKWTWLQEFAQGSIWPSFTPRWWPIWLLVYGLMAAHSASLVAILQPQSRWRHVMFNDPVPCGVDVKSLTLNPTLTVFPDLDKVAEQIGLQFGNYYDQVAANTTTVITGRSFVKDNFGYGVIGGLTNGLQEVPGVEIVAECAMPHEVNTVPLATLWSAAFPGQVLPAPTITNGSGTFGTLPESTSQQAFITSGPTFKLTGTQGALYAIVNASGGGGLLTVSATGSMAGCTWTAVPQLVHLQTLNRVSATISADNATTLPLPTGRAVYAAVQGMAQAVRLSGTRLDWVQSFGFGTGGYPVSAPVMLQTLLADALKGVLTAYTSYAIAVHYYSAFTGASQCYSNNRMLSLQWHFGNEYNLGWIAIWLSIVFGGLAMYTVWHLHMQRRIKGLDVLKVVDAFKLGVVTVGVKAKDVEDMDSLLYVEEKGGEERVAVTVDSARGGQATRLRCVKRNLRETSPASPPSSGEWHGYTPGYPSPYLHPHPRSTHTHSYGYG